MRSFLSIGVPESMIQGIAGLQNMMRKNEINVNFTNPENLHVTLKFLGTVSETHVKELDEGFVKVFQDVKVFTTSLTGVGCFPNMHFLRVIWLGLDKGEREVCELHKKVDEYLHMLGYAKDEGYAPHVTVSRVRNCSNVNKMKKVLDEMKHVNIGEFKVKKISFMNSELTTKGAIYNTINEYVLK